MSTVEAVMAAYVEALDRYVEIKRELETLIPGQAGIDLIALPLPELERARNIARRTLGKIRRAGRARGRGPN